MKADGRGVVVQLIQVALGVVEILTCLQYGAVQREQRLKRRLLKSLLPDRLRPKRSSARRRCAPA